MYIYIKKYFNVLIKLNIMIKYKYQIKIILIKLMIYPKIMENITSNQIN